MPPCDNPSLILCRKCGERVVRAEWLGAKPERGKVVERRSSIISRTSGQFLQRLGQQLFVLVLKISCGYCDRKAYDRYGTLQKLANLAQVLTPSDGRDMLLL